MTFIITCCNL